MMVKSGKTFGTSFVKLYHFKEIYKKNMMDQKYMLSSAKHFSLNISVRIIIKPEIAISNEL